jgi:hypothetical protein
VGYHIKKQGASLVGTIEAILGKELFEFIFAPAEPEA